MKLLIIAVVILLCFGLISCIRKKQETTDDLDQKVITELQKAGSNLNKPHKIEFFLYFPSKEIAQKNADTIKEEGFDVEVKAAAAGSDWLCLATKKMVPSHSELLSIRQQFTKLANDFHGEYDGWGAEIEK